MNCAVGAIGGRVRPPTRHSLLTDFTHGGFYLVYPKLTYPIFISDSYYMYE